MDDKQKRRLNRQFAVTWFLLLLTILALIFLTARQPHVQTNNYVGEKGETGLQGPIGQTGATGLQGIPGEKGIQGPAGHTTVIENNTTVVKETPVPGQKGEKGDKGDPSPIIQLQVNPETKSLEMKYSDSDLWNVLIPCEQLMRSCEDVDREDNGGFSFQ